MSESCYYEPDYRILSSPNKYENVTINFSNGKLLNLNLVDVSENYMTSIVLSNTIEEIGDDYFDGVMILRGKRYAFRAKVLEKRKYHCFQLSRDLSLKDNHWHSDL